MGSSADTSAGERLNPYAARMRIFLGTFVALTILTIALFFELAHWNSRSLITAFDVGQGDAIMVSHGGYQVLVDGGPDGTVLSALGNSMPFFDRTIDLLVLSHPHMDHLQSFPELLRRYRVAAVLMTGADYPNSRYEEFLTLLAESNTHIIVADPDETITVGPITVDVLWPPPTSFGMPMNDVNNDSVAMRITTQNGKSILCTGDMEKEEEQAMLQAGINLSADILKVAHHGSRTSSSTGFLLAVRPSLAIVSVGKNNSYGLPDEDVLARYATLGIQLRMTMEEGDIKIPL